MGFGHSSAGPKMPENCRLSAAKGDYAEAFQQCAQSWRALSGIAGAEATAQVLQVVTACYEEVAAELDRAMRAVCEHFDSEAYMQVTHRLHLD